jgi:hypothetical protein
MPHNARVHTGGTSRRGSALVLALLLALVLVAVTAGLALRMGGERGIALDDAAQTDALNAAQSGLNTYFAVSSSMPRTGTDSTRLDTTITVSGGNANISVRRIRRGATASDPTLYAVVARGASTRNRVAAGTPSAERAIVQYAQYMGSTFTPNAALTSLAGINKSGASGSFNGADACGARAAVPGVSVPNNGYSGSTAPISGSTGSTPNGIGTEGTLGTAKDAIPMDWATIMSPTGLPYDNVFASGVSTSQRPAWNALFPTPMSAWPITLIQGDATFAGNSWNPGRGILVVTGNLRINGGWYTDGLVLVGGNLDSNGGNTFTGAVLTGLNVKIPGGGFGSDDVVTDDPLSGTKEFQYNSCTLDSALTRLGRFRPIANGQIANYPIF